MELYLRASSVLKTTDKISIYLCNSISVSSVGYRLVLTLRSSQVVVRSDGEVNLSILQQLEQHHIHVWRHLKAMSSDDHLDSFPAHFIVLAYRTQNGYSQSDGPCIRITANNHRLTVLEYSKRSLYVHRANIHSQSDGPCVQ